MTMNMTMNMNMGCKMRMKSQNNCPMSCYFEWTIHECILFKPFHTHNWSEYLFACLFLYIICIIRELFSVISIKYSPSIYNIKHKGLKQQIYQSQLLNNGTIGTIYDNLWDSLSFAFVTAIDYAIMMVNIYKKKIIFFFNF